MSATYLLGLLALTAVAADDRVSYLDNGVLRLGVNLDLGGAITWLSKSGSDTNLINSHDWGRQIQMSFYSGPNPFAPNGKQPHKAWAKLGWNPIQSGDVARHRSKVTEHSNDSKSLHTVCVPMQWPLDNEPGECTFETWITLDGPTVKVRSRLTNARADHTQYHGRHQELPAVYTNGPWWRLLTYQGDRPFSGGELSQIPAKMPWTGWRATENWAALVDDHDWGLGIWEPGVYQFLGGFAGKPGAGGPKDGPTGYVAPLHTDILDHNIVYDYDYTLILGTLTEIRRFVYDHAPRPTPPVWRFERDRQHWSYRQAVDTGWPIASELKVLLDQPHPQLNSPLTCWQAADAPKLVLEAAFSTGPGRATVSWQPLVGGFTPTKSVTFEIIPDGEYHRYEVNLAASPEYRGTLSALRLEPVATGQAGWFVRLKSVALAPR